MPDAAFVSQLAEKHTMREGPLPSTMSADEATMLNPLEVTLEDKYHRLPRLSGTGPSGYRNEYLTTLAALFDDARARQALTLHERFSNDSSSVRLVAPTKELRDGHPP